MGTLTAGTSLALGSGAFTSVSAERTVEIDVVDDPDAYLGLGPCTDDQGNPLPNGEYVQLENGTMTLDLTDDNPTSGGGTGVNAEATSVFDDVFEIENQGSQPVGVWLNVDPATASTGEPAIEFYRDGDQSAGIVGQNEAVCLDVGESICVGFVIRTYGIGDGDDLFAGYPGDDGEAMVVNADANVGCGSGSDPTPSYVREWAADYDGGLTSLGSRNNGDPLANDRDDPTAATGAPDGEFVSLGMGGELVLEFDDPLVQNPGAPDLTVHEVTNGRSTYPEEEAAIEAQVMPPGGSWQSVGIASSTASNGVNTFDFGSGIDEVEKIRIVDQTDQGAAENRADGFDVDAVGGWIETP